MRNLIEKRWRPIAALLLVLVLAFVFIVPPIPQSLTYLVFADRRAWLGIPNFADVVSNAFFFVFGYFGVAQILRAPERFAAPTDRWPYFVFFAMIFATGIGSTYFHLLVDTDRLFWDRLPISLAFMALLAGVIGDRTRPGVGTRLLLPLLGIGAASTLTWYLGEKAGAGDLRFYALVQYGSMPVLVILLLKFRARYSGHRDLWLAMACYVVAKICEVFDGAIFSFGEVVSGHTLKHLAAGVGTYFIFRMIQHRQTQ